MIFLKFSIITFRFHQFSQFSTWVVTLIVMIIVAIITRDAESLSFLWDSDSKVRKFRTVDSDFSNKKTWTPTLELTVKVKVKKANLYSALL